MDELSGAGAAEVLKSLTLTNGCPFVGSGSRYAPVAFRRRNGPESISPLAPLLSSAAPLIDRLLETVPLKALTFGAVRSLFTRKERSKVAAVVGVNASVLASSWWAGSAIAQTTPVRANVPFIFTVGNKSAHFNPNVQVSPELDP